MNYTIVKRIKIEAPTLEEAIQNHNNGQTISMTAEESIVRTAPPVRNSTAPQGRPVAMGGRPRA
jgi:hypothetical protein